MGLIRDTTQCPTEPATSQLRFVLKTPPAGSSSDRQPDFQGAPPSMLHLTLYHQPRHTSRHDMRYWADADGNKGNESIPRVRISTK